MKPKKINATGISSEKTAFSFLPEWIFDGKWSIPAGTSQANLCHASVL